MERPSGGRAGTRALGHLASLHGVQRSYTGVDGRRHRTPAGVLAAVLASLGVPVTGPADAAEAWRAEEAARSARVVEPVLVHRPEERRAWPVSLARSADTANAWVELVTEDGERRRRRLDELCAAPAVRSAADGRPPVTHPLDPGRFGALPPGYHRLAVETAAGRHEAVVVAAPPRCPELPGGWGLVSPLHALRGAQDWGTGDLGDLAALAELGARFGGTVTGTLPLCAAFLDGPEPEPSPYRPASRLAWNEVYLDLAALDDLAVSSRARAALASPGLGRQAARLAASERASLPEVAATKRRVLQPLAEDFFASAPGSTRRRAHRGWAERHPEVVAYARFRAERAGEPAEGPALAAPAGELAYHLYVQWAVDQQLGALGERRALYLDLPVGVHPEGFDPTWAPEAFVTGASCGAPPDDFFSGGQSWGLPPLHPEGARADGYRHLADVLRRAMSHASVLRLDHVMGLHRMWFVPEGHAASEGAYVRYRSEELRAVAVLEAWRAGCAVVGEDLGTVPAAVRAAMDRDGMARMSVWQFGASPATPLPPVPPGTVASVGTHDLPPFAAVVDPAGEPSRRSGKPGGPGGPGGWRTALGPLPAALRRVLVHLADSTARLVLVDLADLWFEREPQNRPGTSTVEGSFRLRARRNLAELAADPAAADLLAAVGRARDRARGAT